MGVGTKNQNELNKIRVGRIRAVDVPSTLDGQLVSYFANITRFTGIVKVLRQLL